jgi:hypothetical protein
MMWLIGRLAPDHKSIADFRSDNGPAIKKAYAQFVDNSGGMTATAATFVASRPVLEILTSVVHVQIECGRIWRWRVLCTNA